MVDKDKIHDIFGILGNIIAFAVFASPMLTFYKIYKRKAVEEFSPNPYLAGLMNCLLWVLYGLPFVHPKSTPVLTINSAGLCIEIIYLGIYIYYAVNDRRLWVVKVIGVEAVFYTLVVGLTLCLARTHEKRSLIVGILCVIFGICMYAMPLDVMRLVISTKSVEYLPFYLSLTSFLNGCVWTIYALIQLDLFILISNGVGALLGLVQLILYGIYCRSATNADGQGSCPRGGIEEL